MAQVIDKIMQILHECHPIDDFEVKSSSSNKSLEKIKSDTEQLLADTQCNYVGSVEYASLNKMLAICNLRRENTDELAAIYHLVESHAVILRQHIQHRYKKSQFRESLLGKSSMYGLKPMHMGFKIKFSENNKSLKSILSELPKEWYMLQVTAQYESPSTLRCVGSTSSIMHAIHLTILPTGSSEIEPLCITLPKPTMQTSYDVCREIHDFVASNKSKLEGSYVLPQHYWIMRHNQDTKLKTAIDGLEKTWLREWRVLFMADPIEDFEIISEIYEMIDKLILDSKSSDEISNRCKWLLKKVSIGACFLSREEIARAIKFLLPEHRKLANNVILSIYGKLLRIKKLEDAKRKTLALIIDEHMDYISFEAMEIIKNHPVTRFPSLHIAYTLFKEHESTIVEGCKIIKSKKDMGMCIINPSANLNDMEKRMKLFIDFWLPQWKSSYHTEPSKEMFKGILENYDILMYNGHGSGTQYLPGDDIERMKVRSTVLLFGCNSVRLFVIGGRYPPYGIANQYLIASSPCLVGALWEITDINIDILSTNFISNWIPSLSDRSWTDVDVKNWLSGNLKFADARAETKKDEVEVEPEMLRAIVKSKFANMQYTTKAAIIVRGLPIKIV